MRITMTTNMLAVAIAAAMLPSLHGRMAMPAGSSVYFETNSRHLFVDDFLIERMTGGVGVRQGTPIRYGSAPFFVYWWCALWTGWRHLTWHTDRLPYGP